jgi:acetate kinase
MRKNILVLNAGSSTLKYQLLDMAAGQSEAVLAEGLVEKSEGEGALAEQAIRECADHGIDAIGFRVVHGGPDFEKPAKITPDVIAAIRAASKLAPLHNDLALSAIEAAMAMLPDTPAVAVFDTAFHQTIPPAAATYAIPAELAAKHSLRRYGFHGISYRYVSQQLLELMNCSAAGSKLIVCHLGNGCSICAIQDGRSIDTSMGLTPMEGLVMGTRCGDVDPGLVLFLINELKMSGAEVDNMLNRQSGLLGIAKKSDMRELENLAKAGDTQAQLTIDIFAYRIRKYIGSYIAALGGLDAIAFTGGIGEHSANIRGKICEGLDWLGIVPDDSANSAIDSKAGGQFHSLESRVQLWAVPTNEQVQIAREVTALLSWSDS